MKNKTLKNLALATSIILAASANPARASNFYGGVEAGRQSLSLAGQERFYRTGTFVPAVLLGYSLPNNYALEIAYSQSSGSKSGLEDASQGISNGSTKVKMQSVSIDALKTFKPFETAPKVGLIAIASVSLNRADISESGDFFGVPNSAKSSATGLGYGLGAGVSYDLSDRATLRVKVKHNIVNLSTDGLAGTGGVNNATTVSVGAVYRF